jgi:hypothetical protein
MAVASRRLQHQTITGKRFGGFELRPRRGASLLGSSLLPVPAGNYQPRSMTGVAPESADPRADRDQLAAKGVDVDAELMGGDGTVPLLFFSRDHPANHLMVIEA